MQPTLSVESGWSGAGAGPSRPPFQPTPQPTPQPTSQEAPKQTVLLAPPEMPNELPQAPPRPPQPPPPEPARPGRPAPHPTDMYTSEPTWQLTNQRPNGVASVGPVASMIRFAGYGSNDTSIGSCLATGAHPASLQAPFVSVDDTMAQPPMEPAMCKQRPVLAHIELPVGPAPLDKPSGERVPLEALSPRRAPPDAFASSLAPCCAPRSPRQAASELTGERHGWSRDAISAGQMSAAPFRGALMSPRVDSTALASMEQQGVAGNELQGGIGAFTNAATRPGAPASSDGDDVGRLLPACDFCHDNGSSAMKPCSSHDVQPDVAPNEHSVGLETTECRPRDSTHIPVLSDDDLQARSRAPTSQPVSHISCGGATELGDASGLHPQGCGTADGSVVHTALSSEALIVKAET